MSVYIFKEIKREFLKIKHTNKVESNQYLNELLMEMLYPEVSDFCEEHKDIIKKCWPLKRSWNNASIAAFMTYEENIDFLEDLYQKKNKNLIALYKAIEHSYELYQDQDIDGPFSKYFIETYIC